MARSVVFRITGAKRMRWPPDPSSTGGGGDGAYQRAARCELLSVQRDRERQLVQAFAASESARLASSAVSGVTTQPSWLASASGV